MFGVDSVSKMSVRMERECTLTLISSVGESSSSDCVVTICIGRVVF